MKRTQFLTAAYDVRMELLVILLLLTSLDKNSDLLKQMRSALDFYREHRDLITMFAAAAPGMGSAAPKSDASPEPPHDEQKKESRPAGGDDSLKILEDYLKRAAG